MTALPAKVNVLLVGTGGREHALAWRIAQSPHLGTLFVDRDANAGLRDFGSPCPEPFTMQRKYYLQRWMEREQIGFIIIGPEGPLAEGLADVFALPTRPVFGPSRAASRLEWDKAWAKLVMRQTSVPTAEGRTLTTLPAALAYVTERNEPCVVKASGLCAGKGVTVCKDTAEAVAAVKRCMDTRDFGDAGSSVVIEERLDGQEVSVFALVDGKTITLLDTVQDHKQVGEGDTGPNTGGMGAYSPTPLLDDAQLSAIARDIFVPTVDGLRRQGIEYRGVLFAGLMLTHAGPKVLEFNCRFGDPETQVLMARFRGDLLDVLWRTATGTLDGARFDFDPRSACCVVVCSAGYPSSVKVGLPITGLSPIPHGSNDGALALHFHAGTTLSSSREVITNGGRVVGVTALGPSLAEAATAATNSAAAVRFDGAFLRRDIGYRVLRDQLAGR